MTGKNRTYLDSTMPQDSIYLLLLNAYIVSLPIQTIM